MLTSNVDSIREIRACVLVPLQSNRNLSDCLLSFRGIGSLAVTSVTFRRGKGGQTSVGGLSVTAAPLEKRAIADRRAEGGGKFVHQSPGAIQDGTVQAGARRETGDGAIWEMRLGSVSDQ